MSDLQILVTSMGQSDFSLIRKMNLGCDAIIANQADREEILTETAPCGTVKMITTTTRGVGLNRNIALLASSGELILFADDDVTYYDETPAHVVDAFRQNPDADVIIFGMDYTKEGKIIERRHLKRKRLHLWRAMRFGAVSLAVRREALLRCNIMFHQFFGGGCIYSSGEDSLFLKACFEHGLHVYSHDYVLGLCCRDESSWFSGCNEKYFYDKGVLMSYLFPRFKIPMALYFAVNFKKPTDISCFNRIRLMFAGLRSSKTMTPYQSYAAEKNESSENR